MLLSQGGGLESRGIFGFCLVLFSTNIKYRICFEVTDQWYREKRGLGLEGVGLTIGAAEKSDLIGRVSWTGLVITGFDGSDAKAGAAADAAGAGGASVVPYFWAIVTKSAKSTLP